MYYLLGIALALAALLTINALISVAASALWRLVRGRVRSWSARARARLLFTLRTFPPLASAICVAALLLPAYLAYEPHGTDERIGLKLAALATVSAGGCLLALWRGLSSWRSTRLLIADWLSRSEPVRLDGVDIPVYRVKHSFPVIAVVGALRPRLFIAGQLFELLTPEELAAALRHESGHLAARDNLRRPLVRACSDVLSIVPCGRRLDRAWKEESEAAADEFAAQSGGAAGALALASALVKISRAIPRGARPVLPAGAFLFNEAEAGIVSRVGWLLWFSGDGSTVRRARTLVANSLAWVLYGSLLAAVAFLATQTDLLIELHRVMERCVAALQ
jgi:Zn-dependent protease with chaperone function